MEHRRHSDIDSSFADKENLLGDLERGNPYYEEILRISQEKELTEKELEQAREHSFEDDLTGCYNTRYFNKLKTENFDPYRDDNKIGLVFFDLNGLKIVNDVDGHLAGDELIKSAADFLRGNFRKEDVVVRYGGDEFLVICGNDENDEKFSDMLRAKVSELMEEAPVDMAYGVAVYDARMDFRLDDTLERADQRMYRRKSKMKKAAAEE